MVLNAYGDDVAVALESYTERPFQQDAFTELLPFALIDIDGYDSDGDDWDNGAELLEGTLPGDAASVPGEPECPADVSELVYKICEYDRSYTYRKLAIDFCGLPPTFEEMEAFRGLTADAQDAELHAKLDTCLDSQFWLGFDGVLWEPGPRQDPPAHGVLRRPAELLRRLRHVRVDADRRPRRARHAHGAVSRRHPHPQRRGRHIGVGLPDVPRHPGPTTADGIDARA